MGLVWKIIGSIFIIPFFTICSGLYTNDSAKSISNSTIFIEESPLKMSLLENIVRKICNISLNTFSNKDPTEKGILLERIEEKLNKSARALGTNGVKYVNLIMKGVKAKAFENNQALNYKQAVENKPAADNKNNNIEIQATNVSGARNEKAIILRTETKSNFKNDMVENIAKKIELLGGGHLIKAKNEKERQTMADSIKNMIVKSADRKHATPDEIKAYVDLVTQGIELVMKRNSINRRRMEFVYTNNFNFNKDSQEPISILTDPIKPDSPNNNEQSREASKPKSVILRLDQKTTLQSESSCDSSLEEACQKIKMLKVLRCLSDNREFNILKLCDGVGDCLDFSDEKQCGHQAIETIQTANRLLADVDISMKAQHCPSDLLDKSMLLKQNKVLSDVLKNQLGFLNKHSDLQTFSRTRRDFNTEESSLNQGDHVIKETVRDAVNIVDSLTSALELSICRNKRKELNIDTEYIEKQIRQASQNKAEREICKCNGQNCLQTCSPRCEHICLEMYGLSQLACDAVSGDGLVSLDMVCDGKLDCYDEFDEKDCSEDISLAKFEATQMYDYVLKEIELKTASITFEAVRSRLQSLYALVKKLQKLSLKRQPDLLHVKRARQACFEELTKVFDSALTHIKINENELFNIRFFLITLNERLISALKRSHTGNDKIISSDGCVCRANKCALPRCSKSCTRACSAEPQLTRFFCGKVSDQINNSIPIELVCNGKVNCPSGDDEKDCKKDVCLSHHLKLLRHKLQDAGKQHSGTTLGEALRSWRIKVTATLMIAETNERPTPIVMYDILHDMLHDLVMTYSVLEDRRNNTPVFDEFYSWSRVVIDTLKSCGQ